MSDVSDDDIVAIITEAKEEAVKAIKNLGTVVKGGKWEERSAKKCKKIQPTRNDNEDSDACTENEDEVDNIDDDDNDDDEEEEDDDDENDEDDGDGDSDNDNKNNDMHNSDDTDEKPCSAAAFKERESEMMMLEDIYSEEEFEAEAISADVAKLSNDGVIDKALCNKLKFENVDSSTIPLYATKSIEHHKHHEKKHSLYLELIYKEKRMFIHKTTAVWLFQESEHVSPDRLFRVRSKQPNSIQRKSEPSQAQALDVDAPLPVVCSSIKVGDICVSKCTKAWHVGKVLQFKFIQGRTIKSQQYQGTSAKVETLGFSVLCLWYMWHPSLTLQTFSIPCKGKNSV